MPKTVKRVEGIKLKDGESLTGTFVALKERLFKWGTGHVLYLYSDHPMSMFAGVQLVQMLKENPESMEKGRLLTIKLTNQEHLSDGHKVNRYELVIHDRVKPTESKSGPEGTVFLPNDPKFMN